MWNAADGAPIDVKALTAAQRGDRHLEEAVNLAALFSEPRSFSIDTLLAHFAGQKTVSPPLPSAEASISTDLDVFDVTNDANPEWMRIWVLKRAGLPVRIRLWDPRQGDSVEMLFDYMLEQPADAFEPASLSRAMQAPASTNRLYSLLREPGEKMLTPSDMFAKSGYHMPEVVDAGRTTEGVVWVKSGKSENRTPDGATFFGFGRLTDNLGQEYLRRFVSHEPTGDTGLEYFIPLDLGAGFRAPEYSTLPQLVL